MAASWSLAGWVAPPSASAVAFGALEAAAAPPSCPFCGRVAGSWSSVPLCSACRRALALLPPAARRSFLLLARLFPAPRGGVSPAVLAGQLPLV